MKTLGHDGIHGFWFKKLNLHSRRTSTRNEQISTRRTPIRTDDQRKDHIDPDRLTQKNHPKQQ